VTWVDTETVENAGKTAMEKKKPKSLRIRIAVLYFLLTSITLVVLLFIVSDNQIDIMTENARYQARDMLHQISRRLKEITSGFSMSAHTDNSRSNLIELVKPILADSVPEYALCDQTGNIIVASAKPPLRAVDMGMSCRKALTVSEFTGDEYILSVDAKKERIFFYYPLNIASIEPVVLYIPYDLSRVNSKFQRYYLSLILTIVVVVSLNIVMTLVIYRWIILPITRLRDSAREIAKGKYDIRVKVSDNDEIGELAYSFNAMSGEIERNVGRLNEANRKLERLATVDELTGLFNRRYFYEVFQVELENFKRYNNYFSIIMADIDKFKQVNDSYGHEAGDRILQGVSAILSYNTRKGDTVARFGGEEFILLLPMTNKEGAVLSAEKMRQEIENMTVQLVNGLTIKVTASFGISDVGMLEMLSEEIYRQRIITLADQALYKAKETGRNKTVVYRPEFAGQGEA
jgi:diguanylate cyclase (GGDEF)-like protein